MHEFSFFPELEKFLLLTLVMWFRHYHVVFLQNYKQRFSYKKWQKWHSLVKLYKSVYTNGQRFALCASEELEEYIWPPVSVGIFSKKRKLKVKAGIKLTNESKKNQLDAIFIHRFCDKSSTAAALDLVWYPAYYL